MKAEVWDRLRPFFWGLGPKAQGIVGAEGPPKAAETPNSPTPPASRAGVRPRKKQLGQSLF